MLINIEVPVREIKKAGDYLGGYVYVVRERTYNGRWKKVSMPYIDRKNAQAALGRLVLADIEERSQG